MSSQCYNAPWAYVEVVLPEVGDELSYFKQNCDFPILNKI